ncbi:FmdB family transcriptional regulator [Candidatus Pacearchaeota archaeon]|nr:FmdB family transcriptional regulator [Candidatus Pacearchaeota archaeon]
MPIYEYVCSNCGHEEEVLQKIDDVDPTCPKCVEIKTKPFYQVEHIETIMHKKISKSAVIFKGSGFYETDYKKKQSTRPHKKVNKSEKEQSKSKDEPSQPPSKKQ